MKFVPKNPLSVLNTLKVLQGVSDEVYLTPKRNSVVFWTIDKPRTMIYSAVMPKANLLVYEVDKSELDSITTYDIRYLLKALKKVKADTPFTFNQTNEGMTEIKLEKPVKITAKVPQLTSEVEELTIPEIPFEAFLTAYGALLNELVGTIKEWAPVVEIKATEEKITFSGETETTEVLMEIEPDNDWVQEYELGEEASIPIEVHLDAKRLAVPLKGITKSSVVTFAFGSDMPVYIRWEDVEGFRHQFLLAPRVKDE